MNAISLLAISGSLRAASSNTTLLRAIEGLLPAAVQLQYSVGLEQIPPFNPDNDQAGSVPDPAVALLRQQIAAANAVLICTPEYAFGVPGALKNALDWTVSSGSLNEKPVAAISASPLYTGGSHALASLLLTLKALGAAMNEHSSLSVPSVNKIFAEDGKLNDASIAAQLQQVLGQLIEAAAS